jgi:hypothetical protein
MCLLSRVFRTAALPAVAILVLYPLPSLAQRVTLRGLVVTAAEGTGIPGVLVALESGERGKTDDRGAFVIDGVAPGPHRVALVAPGCQVTLASVDAVAGEDRAVAFHMPYDPKIVAAARRRSAIGRVITAVEIERMHARDLTDVLSRTLPGLVSTVRNQPGQQARLRSRGAVSLQGEVEPAIEVDGVLMGEAALARIDDIPPTDVAWIQVLRGASGGWEVGTGGSGGLIRIQTKRGDQMDAPIVEPERCQIPGWED